MLKKAFLLLILAITCWSCVATSSIPASLSATIPEGSNIIKVYSNQSFPNFYKTIYRKLASKGFIIVEENNKMGTITTGFKPIGQGAALMMNVFVKKTAGGSVAKIRGRWNFRSSLEDSSIPAAVSNTAYWAHSGYSKLAFGKMAVFANSVNHKRIEYLAE